MIAQVRPGEFDAWLQSQAAAGAVPLLIDVREPWEVQTAAVRADGFELLAIPMNTIPTQIAKLDPDRPVAVLCHHGARSQRVAMFLEQQGFAKVVNIAGGIDAWSAERDPSVARY